MKDKSIYNLLIFFVLFLAPFAAAAQTLNKDSLQQARQHTVDSTRQARQHYVDSVREVRSHFLDSLNVARQHQQDSLNKLRQHRNDSLAAIRAYRNSQQYKDSIAAIRQERKDSILTVRKHFIDSAQQARQHYTDSVITQRKEMIDSMKLSRQHYLDSLHNHYDSLRAARAVELQKLKAVQEHRRDSLTTIRAYRNSQHYKDSVATVRQHYRDSLIAVRKAYTDSVRTVQKAQTDSLIADRKRSNDSLRASLDSMRLVRQQTLDSLTKVRKVRSDSLAKVTAARTSEREAKEKEREKKKGLAVELKIKEKQENYSNKQMLKKKWTLLRRITQNTYTRYNYYYNVNLKMEEARANMLRVDEDDYDALLKLFPFDPNVDSGKLASDMDSIISRASVGIQIHDPRSKWQGDLYLLVGEAYYYKADYDNAGAAFKQIIVSAQKRSRKKAQEKKNKKKSKEDKVQTFSVVKKKGIAGLFQHMPAKNKAMLWLARTLVQDGKAGQAQSLLDLLRNDANFPKEMEGRLALEQAFIDLEGGNTSNAINPLRKVAGDKHLRRWQRQRAGFMVGQLYSMENKPDSANTYFHKVLALHPPLKMDFYAQKNIAFNDLGRSGDKGQTLKLLSNLAKDGKYKPYYDQIYYGLALAAQKDGDEESAMEDFRKSLKFSINNPKQKGLTYTAIGDAYYKSHQYVSAKKMYDSAAISLGNNQSLPEYERASLRGSALANITAPAQIVASQDSLLHLASLSEKEQRTFIRKYIRELEKAKRDSLFLAQNTSSNPSQGSTMAAAPNAQNWYFANPIRVKTGTITFKQKWGDRKLEDNWRLSNKLSAGTAAANPQEKDNQKNLGLPDEETLYAAIPHSKAEIDSSRRLLEEGLFQLGKGYYSYLEDFKNTQITFDTLGIKFPNNPHQAEVLYLRYLMAVRSYKTNEANDLLQSLKQGFPDSKWVGLVKESLNKNEKEEVKDTANKAEQQIDLYYDNTYNMLGQKQYALVIDRAEDFVKLYPTPGSYANKFLLMKSAALIGSGKSKEADSILTDFIKKHPKDSLTTWAKDLKNFIDNRNNENGNKLTGNKGTNNLSQEAEFTFNKEEPYLIIIVAPADMRIFALKSGMRDFNMIQSTNQNISISITTLSPEDNLILCQTFKDLKTAKSYYKEILKQPKLFQEYNEGAYHLLLISRKNYQIMLQQRNVKKYLPFYNKYYQ